MHIKSIHLRNFRNFDDLRLEFSSRFNIISGKNAQGKTNIIEAISLLSSGRSFRTIEFRDTIRWECESADLLARVAGNDGEDDLRASLDLSKKKFFLNSRRKNSAGFAGLGTVIFAPEEILLLRDSPSARRHYLDGLIAQLSEPYRGVVRRYERIVSHRNRLLQEASGGAGAASRELKAFDEQLVMLGGRIAIERSAWCSRLNEHLPGKYAAIAPDDGAAHFTYRPHCGDEAVASGEGAVRGALQRQLEARFRDELERGITLVGPHRDDVEAQIDGAAAKRFGSQGQHRTFVLALKIAEMELMNDVLGEMPILLLDDVASELDEGRNSFFFDYLKRATGQVFVTATRPDDICLDARCETKRFEIKNGTAKVI